jgi:hypothetical protein
VIDEGKRRIMQSQVLDALAVNGLFKDVTERPFLIDVSRGLESKSFKSFHVQEIYERIDLDNER